MKTLAQRPSVMAGVVLFALFGIVDVLSPWIFPAPASAPPIANTLTLIAGVIALVVLAVWLATSSRVAMWIGVVIRVIGGVFSIMAFTDPTASTGFVVANVIYLALTIVAIVLVAPTLRARVSSPAVPAG
ncbi:hypothetical protein LQ327_05365 [Actinomycetospora endophytica]|uniref:Integral membrane protein n=1 Tax=Actinomycetospora endophytica TaxID=2291215 RepID=A0ABS8P3K4_9PSEU|nr:hypothetical protein [Actinomycetospora endophytica]MCD2192816.1 hypothetical protein [Actinomycetospora endophytica]